VAKSSQKHILVITRTDDGHIPFVQRHLDRPFTIVDPLAVLQGTTLTYHLDKDGNLAVISNGERLESIKSVWYRKPGLLPGEKLQLNLPAELREFSEDALHNFMRLLGSRFPDAFWISRPNAIRHAADKLLQLECAAKLGFKVPETLVTSSAATAKDFVRKHARALTKPIAGYPLPAADGKMKIFYAHKIGKKDFDYSGLHLAPAIFQPAIDAALDIRVTVVRDKVFAAAITGSAIDEPLSMLRDWRIAYTKGNLTIEAFDLPRKIADLSVKLVRQLGLEIGALDFVLDRRGTFWFLENNANGQWAFVEERTGQQIGKAVANLLMSGKQGQR